MKTKELDSLLIAVNSTKCIDKYPFGNVTLTKQLKDLEHKMLIIYDVYTSRWTKYKRG
jgi:hypothetical protein